jgi:hypothetical protein
MSGEFDLVFCNGYCPPILSHKVNEMFPASKGLEVYSQPSSGHAINLSVSFFMLGLDDINEYIAQCHWFV